MSKDMLKAFIIGSSWLVFVFFFIGFGRIQDEINPNNCTTNLLGGYIYHCSSIISRFYECVCNLAT